MARSKCSARSRTSKCFNRQSSGCWSTVMSEQKKIRIVVLGGGFAGLHAAIHLDDTLARDPDIEITLVNRDNFFLFTPMLHEVAASDLDLTNIVNPIRKLLKRVNFFAGEVESIDLDRKRVRVSHGFDHHHHELNYDHLVIGLGSITNFYHLPGLEERALTMKSLGDAIHLRNRLISLLEEADSECCANVRGPLLTFVVAGGGHWRNTRYRLLPGERSGGSEDGWH